MSSLKKVSLGAVALGLGMSAFAAPITYKDDTLWQVSFPIGGFGTGMYCVEGTGSLGALSVRHQMEFFNEPNCFAAVTVLGENGAENITRVLEGPVPKWKYFNRPAAARGYEFKTYGLPRFRECSFTAKFPFAEIDLADKAMPVTVKLTAWSPFIPGDIDASGLPAGALEYAFTNTTDKPLKAIFSFSSYNVMNGSIGPNAYGQVSRWRGSIGPIDGGFVCYGSTGEGRTTKDAFAFFVDSDDVKVNHTWFRGGWWDPITIAWEDIAQGRMIENPSTLNSETGATLTVPVELAVGETKTITLNTCWYVPESGQRHGAIRLDPVAAFGKSPTAGTAKLQNKVSNYLGDKLVNSFDGTLDTGVGTVTSPLFTVERNTLSFLVGGGKDQDNVAVQILSEDGKMIASSAGEGSETLTWKSHDVSALKGQKVRFRIVDHGINGWSHILADHFIASDEAIDKLLSADGTLTNDASRYVVLQDFENGYGDWIVESTAPAGDGHVAPSTYTPWYASQYKSVTEVANAWLAAAPSLRARSAAFSHAIYSQTLPSAAIDAITANLAILKTPTVMRQHDGKLWGWEGNNDVGGSCIGTCSHVWNYAQALSHLFPAGERCYRDTQFFFGQEYNGRQAFRKNLPITKGGIAFDAADGHCGEIMSVHREWRISGDEAWLARFWPKVKSAMDYATRTWDPEEIGLLVRSHHNTYDINYTGANGHCSSFYLGALEAAIRMGEALGQNVDRYRMILTRGKERFEKDLFNGEYFIQLIVGSAHLNPADQGPGYSKIVAEINTQGPKYQYGTGCLSDGVLGFWMAKVCGIDDDIVNPDMVLSHLKSVYKYNFKPDLSGEANPQRPAYAMGSEGGLLLCSWPKGGKPHIPFVYSDEVWTGIEYQVASHLMLFKEYEKGMDIVKACRARYDGSCRNPFNEIECGHFYARAMASYAIIQGMSGLEFDAVDDTLYLNKDMPNARFFLATDTGFGVVSTDAVGKPSVEVIEGEIPVKKTVLR